MSSFTPGPWAANPFNAQVDAMPSTTPICKMLWPTDERSEEETEANARLIAAAPDLLNALRLFLDNSSVQASHPYECEFAEKIVAKATGGSDAT